MTISFRESRRRANRSERIVFVPPRPTRILAYALLGCAIFVGCKTGIDASALQKSEDEKIEKMASTDDVHGPMERFMKSAGFGKKDKKEKALLVNPPEAMAAYQQAEELIKQKKYDAAKEILWKNVAKKYENYPIREDAVFLTGECLYHTEHFAGAMDKYDLVIKEYPTTRHLDEISRRKFEVARIWLNFPEIITAEQVRPVNFEQPSSTPPPQTSYQPPTGLSYTIPIWPELWDKRRPVFDTQGRALEALKSIWLNDPTGPLADDALMLSASYYLRKGDYVEADHLYDLLRKEFNKSPHLENAYVLGAHCKLMSYQGAEYGGTELEEAEQLKKQILKLYPNRPDRPRIEQDLQLIQKAKAARLWADVKFYKSKNKPKAVAIACKNVIRKFPDSEYAQLARAELARIKPEDKRESPPPNKQYEDLAKAGKNGKAGKATIDDAPGLIDDGSSPKSASGVEPALGVSGM